jgi:hypothetical protein
MTMLSPLGRVPKQRPVGPRRARRPVPALILLLALSLVTAVVWWKVLHRDSEAGDALAGCQPVPTLASLKVNPKTVKLRVYNSTDKAGLAKSAADQLHKRGFAITKTSNDPLGASREVQGVGELRYGPSGANQALLTSLYLPGIRLVQDPRTDAVVDVAIGPSYKAIATAAQVTAARKKATAQAKKGEVPQGC